MPTHIFALRTILCCSALLATAPAQVQRPSPPNVELLTRQRDEKRQLPVFRNHGWGFDYDAARAEAARRHTAILAYFTASHTAQPACIALESGLLAEAAFHAVLRDFVPFAHITTGIPDEPHANLLQKRSISSVPSISYLDADGELIAIQRKLDLASIQATAALVLAYTKARNEVAKTDGKEQRKQLFLVELDLGRITPKDLDGRLAALTLTPAERAELDPRLLDLELQAIQTATHERNRAEQCATVFRIFQQGRRPTATGAPIFWGMLLHHAAKTKAVALATQAHAELLRLPDPAKSPERMAQVRELWQQLVAEAHGN